MNLRQIRLFVAIAEEESVSRGAERELLTQSTASQHIASLEEELGVRLFDRTARGVVLTEGGNSLLLRARRVLASCVDLQEEAQRFAGMVGATVRVGCSTIPANYLMPQILVGLRQTAPDLRILLTQGGSDSILQLLVDGEVEVAVVGKIGGEKSIRYEPLCEDRMVLVALPDHPSAGLPAITVKSLVTETLLLREPGSGSGKTISDALRLIGVGSEVVARWPVLGSTEAIREGVLQGLGIAFLSSCAVEREVANGSLVELKVEGVSIVRKLHLARRAGRTLSPGASTLCEALLGRFG